MKRLKIILKEALSFAATEIHLQVGEPYLYKTNKGKVSSKSGASLDMEYMKKLYTELFDRGEEIFPKKEPRKGRLVVNGENGAGEYSLFAKPSLLQLIITTPLAQNGAEKIENLYQEALTGKSQSPVAPAPMIPPLGAEIAEIPLMQAPELENFSCAEWEEPVVPPIPKPLNIGISNESIVGFELQRGAQVPASVKSQDTPDLGCNFDFKELEKAVEKDIGKVPPTPVKTNQIDEFTVPLVPTVLSSDQLYKPTAEQAKDSVMVQTELSRKSGQQWQKQDQAMINFDFDKVDGAAEKQGSTRMVRDELPLVTDQKIEFGPIDGSVKGESKNPIDQILTEMIAKKASDIHLLHGEEACLRVDGDIVRMQGWKMTEQIMQSFFVPIIPEQNKMEFIETNDTDFPYEIPGKERFRVNLFRDKSGVGAVLRRIPVDIPSAEKLELSPTVLKLCDYNKGLILVTGPTGSGKSTTLAAMIDYINRNRSKHIITIEDPIEFVHQQKKCLINQRQVNSHTKSFSRALRAALREDPDIVLIGEMRDLETVAIALETSETGHLVFGTLHTNTAVATIDRIIDQFPANQQAQIRTMLSESLLGVVAQTLLKRKTSGRVAAMEILVTSNAVRSTIREGKTHMLKSVLQTKKSEGNLLLGEALVDLVKKGIVDPMEAYNKAVDKGEIIQMLQQIGVQLKDVA